MANRGVALVHHLVDLSIFRPLPVSPMGTGMSMNDILAILFHRAAATMYFIYALWGLFSLILGLPTLNSIDGLDWQLVFSAAVLLTAIPAGLGCVFWPAMARTELYAGSSFVAGMLIYMYFTLQNLFTNNGGSWTSLILLLSIIVVPAARTVVITIFLLVQARAEKAEAIAQKLIQGMGDDVRDIS